LKKRVVIDAGRASNITSGLGQVVYQFAAALTEDPPQDLDIEFLLHKNFIPLLPSGFPFPLKKASVMRRLVPELLSSGDIWHVLNPDSRSVPLGHPRLILTIHDLRILSVKQSSSAARYRKQLEDMLAAAAGITAISAYTRDEVSRTLHVPAVPFVVIHNGIEPPARSDVRMPISIAPPYLFALGGFEEKKRFHLIVEMMQFLPELRLCLAGYHQNEYGALVRKSAEDLGILSRIDFMGVVSEEEKWMLYANCQALVFPSKLEGFGLPVLEAMAMGKPVFISPDGALPEIGGNHALTFPSLTPSAMAGFVSRSLSNEQPDASIQREAYARSFTWKKTLHQYLDFYRSVLESAVAHRQNIQ
jgi:glycosyltransferase involved in cell wall biosynthesis